MDKWILQAEAQEIAQIYEEYRIVRQVDDESGKIVMQVLERHINTFRLDPVDNVKSL